MILKIKFYFSWVHTRVRVYIYIYIYIYTHKGTKTTNLARKYKTEHTNTRDVSTHNKIYTNKNEQRKKNYKIKATQANIGPHSSARLVEAKDSPEFSCTFFNMPSLALIQS
jgi:hypothetical protein